MLLWIFWPDLQAPQGWRPTHFSGGKTLSCWLWPQSLLEIILGPWDNSHTTPKCSTAVGVSCKNLFFLFVTIWYIFLIFLKWSHLKSLEIVSEALRHTVDECVCGCLFHVLIIISSWINCDKCTYFHTHFLSEFYFLIAIKLLEIVAPLSRTHWWVTN